MSISSRRSSNIRRRVGHAEVHPLRADRSARSGASQSRTLTRIRRDHGSRNELHQSHARYWTAGVVCQQEGRTEEVNCVSHKSYICREDDQFSSVGPC